MSKIGKMPVIVKEGVLISVEGSTITVTGPKGNLSYIIPSGIKIDAADGKIQVSKDESPREDLNALFGLTRAQIANMVKGVTDGFEKKLELTGVGYRATVSGSDLMLSVGFSHQVKIPAPDGVMFGVLENVISITGINKSLVGDIAAKVRAVRPPEPYKGKGISYMGERIRRKVGKAAKAVGAK